MFSKYLLIGAAHFAGTALILKILSFILPFWLTCYYTCAAYLLMFLIVATITFGYTKRWTLNGTIQPENKAVLITGCDSGFGHLLAERLDTKGFHVFASCLFPSGPGAAKLRKNCSKRLQILELDVTKDESVRRAVEFVKDNLGTSELWAVVNNAGVLKGFTIELTPLDDFKNCLDVNALGPVRVTKAFLPLLRQSRGRVINMTSLSGRLSLPHVGAYNMSKFAAVAFTECLKQEMEVWGVRVISVEPEMFKTPIVDREQVLKGMDETFSKVSEDVRYDYGEKYLKDFKKFIEYNISLYCSTLWIVIDDLESAVIKEYPDDVYFPCRNVFAYAFLCFFKSVPTPVVHFVTKWYFYILGFPDPKEATNIS